MVYELGDGGLKLRYFAGERKVQMIIAMGI